MLCCTVSIEKWELPRGLNGPESFVEGMWALSWYWRTDKKWTGEKESCISDWESRVGSGTKVRVSNLIGIGFILENNCNRWNWGA